MALYTEGMTTHVAIYSEDDDCMMAPYTEAMTTEDIL